MGKRANGEGTILPYKVKGVQKGWRASIQIGFKNNGSPDRKQFYGKTQKEVKEKLEEYKRNMLIGNTLNKDKITLEDWFYNWLFDYKKSELKATSFTRYYNLYKNYIKNTSLGKIKLQDLKAAHLQKYYKNLLNEGVSPGTINQLNGKLKTCLGEAERQEYILKNYAKIVTLPKIQENKEVSVLTKEQQEKLLEAIKGHDLEMLYIIALSTGIRKGEIRGLKWSDVDFTKGEITVNRTISNIAIYENGEIVGWQLVEQSPKTKNSIRSIPLPKNVLTKLKSYKKEQNKHILYMGEAYNNHDYVFPNFDGNLIDEKTPGRRLNTILKHIDIPPIRFHALRHTYATRLFEARVPPKTVQHLMGHSDITTTMNIYTHVMENEKLEAVDKINNIFV
jgi:phage integrase